MHEVAHSLRVLLFEKILNAITFMKFFHVKIERIFLHIREGSGLFLFGLTSHNISFATLNVRENSLYLEYPLLRAHLGTGALAAAGRIGLPP